MFLFYMFLIINVSTEYKEYKNKVIVDKKDTLIGDVSVIGKDVEVLGGIKGDLVVISGDLKLEGFVKGDVAVIGGNCKVYKGSLVLGDIVGIGDKIHIEKNAKVEGERVTLSPGFLLSLFKILKFFGKGVFITKGEPKKEEVYLDTLEYKEESDTLEKVIEEKEEFIEVEKEETPKKNFLKVFLIMFFVVFYSFLVSLVRFVFPGSVENMRRELELKPFISLAVGFLVQLLYPSFLVILAVSILGIPLALALIFSTPFFLIYGSSPLFIVFGKFILDKFKYSKISDFKCILATSLYLFLVSLITSLFLYFDYEGFFYKLIKFFFFSFSFLNFYVVFTFATGIIFTAKLGIKR
ncbi:MAG: hypothetical protein ABDH37_04770 [Candidatus Hydrothermales bacterium]